MFDSEETYRKILFTCFGKNIKIKQSTLIAAGNINQGIHLETSEGDFFLKLNFSQNPDIFEREASGLLLLKQNCPLKIPQVYNYGSFEDRNFLLLEWIGSGRSNTQYWDELGEGLAQLHMATAELFGLEEDNYIASLNQNNNKSTSWTTFFIENRLEPLIGKAYYDQYISAEFLERFRKIYYKLDSLFPKEKPALLHGDLWSGNVIKGKTGNPVLIDPAVYYGHREMDLAFSRLFGGFDERFYQAYDDVFPLEPDFENRIPIYNLYPLLVHLHLFGKSYLPGIEKTVNLLLA